MNEVQTIHIDGGKDAVDGRKREVFGDGPANDVEIFLSGFQFVDDAIEQNVVVIAEMFQVTKYTTLEFDPKRFALQMFEPFRSQVAKPMISDPMFNRLFTQIATRFFTAIPFESIRFHSTIGIQTIRTNAGR